ncbi:hypothetical protein [Nostoc sp.]
MGSGEWGVGSGEWGDEGDEGDEGDKENNQCPMPNDYFVFIILFNCDAQISKVFANFYYLS